MSFQLLPRETVLKEGDANYQKGWEAVGGKRLVLTTHRLLFESHKLNAQTGGLSIDLREVADVTTAWTKLLGLIPLVPNSMLVRMTNGDEHRFVLFGRSTWIAAIDDQRRTVLRGSKK